MSGDIGVIVVSSLLAMVNPSLLAATTVMLLLPNPKRLMLGYLLGAYTSSLLSGLIIVHSLHGSSVVKGSNRILGPTGDVAVGVLALTVAYILATGRDAPVRRRRERRKANRARAGEEKEPWSERMLEKGSAVLTFIVGAAMSFPGVTYVNALDHIARLNASTLTLLLLIVYFCVMQQILLEGALLASLFAPERTQAAIVRAKTWFTVHGRQLATYGLSGIGLLLAARGALSY
jgi:Sap, sulfolipid-1-addressing protein